MLRAAREYYERDLQLTDGLSSPKKLLKDAAEGRILGMKTVLKVTTTLDPVDAEGNTPFLLAAANGHAAAVEILLNYKSQRCGPIDVQHKNRNGDSVLHLASAGGHVNVVLMLLRSRQIIEDVNAVNKLGNTPLHSAAMKGQQKVINLLVRTPGIKLKIMNADRKTPADVARKNGYKVISDDLHKLASGDGTNCNVM